jgi:hypothetical protein
MWFGGADGAEGANISINITLAGVFIALGAIENIAK